jgi:hypothetical protein
LYLVRLLYALLHDADRFHQHPDFLQGGGNLDYVLRIFHVALGQKAVQQVDAALVVSVVGGHVVGADQVVDAVAWSAHGRRHVVARV